MYPLFTKALIACLLALPSFVLAAETVPEAKPTTTTQTAAPATPAAELKPAPATAVPGTRIGYVDISRVGTESERGKAIKSLLTARKEKLQVKIDGKRKQIEKLKASIESKVASMTPPQREAKSKEFQKKVEEFQKLAQKSEEELMELQEKETKSLFEGIEQAAVAHGKANGFAAIIVKKELLYLGNSVDAQDVTDTLIKAMNQADQKK